MTDFYFDSGYDMSLEGADIAFTNDDNEVVQRLESRLQFILGEWFLDNTAGLPYPQLIFEAGTSIDDVYSLFQQVITDTEGVEKIDSLVITPNERSILVEFSVNNGTSTSTIII